MPTSFVITERDIDQGLDLILGERSRSSFVISEYDIDLELDLLLLEQGKGTKVVGPGRIQKAIEGGDAETSSRLLDNAQSVLDIIGIGSLSGILPVVAVSEAATILSFIMNAARGKYGWAIFDLFSMVPIAGGALKGVKVAKKAFTAAKSAKAADELLVDLIPEETMKKIIEAPIPSWLKKVLPEDSEAEGFVDAFLSTTSSIPTLKLHHAGLKMYWERLKKKYEEGEFASAPTGDPDAGEGSTEEETGEEEKPAQIIIPDWNPSPGGATNWMGQTSFSGDTAGKMVNDFLENKPGIGRYAYEFSNLLRVYATMQMIKAPNVASSRAERERQRYLGSTDQSGAATEPASGTGPNRRQATLQEAVSDSMLKEMEGNFKDYLKGDVSRALAATDNKEEFGKFVEGEIKKLKAAKTKVDASSDLTKAYNDISAYGQLVGKLMIRFANILDQNWRDLFPALAKKSEEEEESATAPEVKAVNNNNLATRGADNYQDGGKLLNAKGLALAKAQIAFLKDKGEPVPPSLAKAAAGEVTEGLQYGRTVLQEDKLTEIVIDFNEIRKNELNESFLAMFGAWIKHILGAMLGGFNIPVSVRGSKGEVQSFARAVGSEKKYIETAKRYGLDHPNTYKSQARLGTATKGFEKETGIKWPFK